MKNKAKKLYLFKKKEITKILIFSSGNYLVFM